MYHSIVPEVGEDPGQKTTPVSLFEEQMAFLAGNGYRVVPAEEIARRLARGEPFEPKTVALTFDDGFSDNHDLAFPVLRKYRFPAAIFLVADAVEGGDHLTWSQAREMQASGLVQFGCHGATHRKLAGLPGRALREETEGARRMIQDRLGAEVPLFAYPFGSYRSWDRAVRAAVERAGFLAAFTAIFGFNTASSDRFLLRRSRVSWRDEIPEFRRLLGGAYDWYALAQWVQA